MLNAPLALRLWLLAMAITFFASVLFVRKHGPARAVLAGFVLTLAFSKLILPALGVTTYSGLVALLHLGFWTPGLVLLLRERFARAPAPPLYRAWSWLIIAVISISFVFDVRDGARYLMHALG